MIRHPVWVTTGACALIVAGTLVSTYVSVWFIGRRPYGIEVSPDRSEVYIRSYSGAPLTTIPGGEAHSVYFADKVPLEPGSTWPWRAAIGFEPQSPGELAGRLAVFDPKGRLVWNTDLAYPEFRAPSPLLWSDRDAYPVGLARALYADVFETSGLELITFHGHQHYSPTSIRIYSVATGECLYEAWHDGALASLLWLPESRLLVGLGVCNRLLPSDFDDRMDGLFCPEPTCCYTPVLFAITPKLGNRETSWIGAPGSASPIRAQWYKALAPISGMVSLCWFRLEHSDGNDDGFYLRCLYDAARFTEPDAIVGQLLDSEVDFKRTPSGRLLVDDRGTIVDRFPSDQYAKAAAPDLRTFLLLDIPLDFDPNVRPRTYRDGVRESDQLDAEETEN